MAEESASTPYTQEHTYTTSQGNVIEIVVYDRGLKCALPDMLALTKLKAFSVSGNEVQASSVVEQCFASLWYPT